MVTCGSEMDGVDLDRELSLSTTSGKHMKFLGCSHYVYLLMLRWRSCVDGISPLVFLTLRCGGGSWAPDFRRRDYNQRGHYRQEQRRCNQRGTGNFWRYSSTLSIDPRKSENWHGSSEDTIQDWKSTTHRYENKCRRERTNNRSYLGVAKSGVEMPKDVP